MSESELPHAMLCLRHGDRREAVSIARRAARSSSDDLGRLVVAALESTAGEGVYQDAGAFEAFIDGASNVALYEATCTRLRSLLEARQPSSVLDIGCGDGRVSQQLANPASVARIDLVEPVERLLLAAHGRLAHTQVEVHTHGTTIEDFLSSALDRTRRLRGRPLPGRRRRVPRPPGGRFRVPHPGAARTVQRKRAVHPRAAHRVVGRRPPSSRLPPHRHGSGRRLLVGARSPRHRFVT